MDGWCLSRRGGSVCTRPRGHAGLHHRGGSNLLWAERDADPAACPGGGAAAEPAALLPDGVPGGRGMCPVCTAFVPIVDGALAGHASWRGGADAAEEASRRTWFNTHGW